jgi:hypothetical protein
MVAKNWSQQFSEAFEQIVDFSTSDQLANKQKIWSK